MIHLLLLTLSLVCGMDYGTVNPKYKNLAEMAALAYQPDTLGNRGLLLHHLLTALTTRAQHGPPPQAVCDAILLQALGIEHKCSNLKNFYYVWFFNTDLQYKIDSRSDHFAERLHNLVFVVQMISQYEVPPHLAPLQTLKFISFYTPRLVAGYSAERVAELTALHTAIYDTEEYQPMRKLMTRIHQLLARPRADVDDMDLSYSILRTAYHAVENGSASHGWLCLDFAEQEQKYRDCLAAGLNPASNTMQPAAESSAATVQSSAAAAQPSAARRRGSLSDASTSSARVRTGRPALSGLAPTQECTDAVRQERDALKLKERLPQQQDKAKRKADPESTQHLEPCPSAKSPLSSSEDDLCLQLVLAMDGIFVPAAGQAPVWTAAHTTALGAGLLVVAAVSVSLRFIIYMGLLVVAGALCWSLGYSYLGSGQHQH